LRFLAHVEKTVGWRTRWMIRELEKQWSELRGLDTWGESASYWALQDYVVCILEDWSSFYAMYYLNT
jgi:hypothetical protein